MRLRVDELLRARGWTRYRLARASGGRIKMRQAYSLAKPHFVMISAAALDTLCDVLGVEPGELFARE